MDPLTALADRYKTDKGSERHLYTPFYDALFTGHSIARVVEIGVLRGASLRMWRDYFGCEVLGVDHLPGNLFHEERIECRKTDVHAEDEVRALAEHLLHAFGPDLIVDDGPHTLISQRRCLELLSPTLRPGGFYVVEDAEVEGFDRQAFTHQREGLICLGVVHIRSGSCSAIYRHPS